jgi:diaminohydroxyphosphoribosylaminopyrimidine deaminase/5-amino-6-(5-phosphoribosylamino)uracil reductase
MTAWTANDEQYMRQALALARRGLGYVEPNPMVGCVLVRGERVLATGYHHRFGGPHAEVDALRRCRTSPRGATAYVTLEPCCHHGKTPPCTDALIAAGIARVVAAVKDPNPRVAGGGFAQLRAVGIRVEAGLCATEAAALNAPFFKLQRQHRPWVILKWAQSLDGKIAAHTGDSKWISDEVCRAHAHRTRGRVDAVVVGVGTVLADDPRLTCRTAHPRRTAARVVLDSDLCTPLRAQLVRTARQVPTWLFCRKDGPAAHRRALEQAGCVVHAVASTRPRAARRGGAKAGGVGLSLPAVLDVLGKSQFTNVLVEGGGQVLGSFFDAGLADECHIYVAPLLVGGRDAPGPLNAAGVARIAAAVRLPDEARLARMGTGYFVAARTGNTPHE